MWTPGLYPAVSMPYYPVGMLPATQVSIAPRGPPPEGGSEFRVAGHVVPGEAGGDGHVVSERAADRKWPVIAGGETSGVSSSGSDWRGLRAALCRCVDGTENSLCGC